LKLEIGGAAQRAAATEHLKTENARWRRPEHFKFQISNLKFEKGAGETRRDHLKL
jgi:hypothetical protein